MARILPFQGLRIANAGFGLAAALTSKFLSEFGAEVIRVVPDGGDPFPALYPSYETLRRHERAGHEHGSFTERLRHASRNADGCILGGEDHPSLEVKEDADRLLLEDPGLVVLEIGGYPSDYHGVATPAVDILIQANSGLCYEQFSDRPYFAPFQPSAYGAALQGLTAFIAALYERHHSGQGQIVRTSLYQGALTWLATWSAAEKADATFDFVAPLDPKPMIMQTTDGAYVHVVLGAKGAKARLYGLLGVEGVEVHPNDSGAPNLKDGADKFLGDSQLVGPYIARWNSKELLEALISADIPVNAVLRPGDCWDNPQIQHNATVARTEQGVRHVASPITSHVSGSGPTAPKPHDSRPLSGITIVDFGAFLAGPLASVALADLGADVIKVEPLAGDPMRAMGRSHNSANRGKRSIALNMKTAKGIEVAQRLCRTATVVTSNFKPGVSTRLGIGVAALHSHDPALVVLESPGYGGDGPDIDRPAFDPVLQAFCGHEWRAGGSGNPPTWYRHPIVDYAGAYLGGLAVLAGLYQRARFGTGAALAVPLVSAGIFLLSELIDLPDGSRAGAPPNNRDQTGFHPAEALYHCRDGWIAIAVRSPDSASALAAVLSLEPALSAPFALWSDAEYGAIVAACRARDSAELILTLSRAGVWATPCLREMEARTLSDPKAMEAGLVRQFDDHRYGRVSVLGPLFHLGRSSLSETKPPPRCGEHSRELLGQVGYDPAEIDELFASGIVA